MNKAGDIINHCRMSAPHACGYLDERTEQLLFIMLGAEHSAERYERLLESGWRRFRTIAYKPHCAGCIACLSLRISVMDHVARRSHSRILKRNIDLKRCYSSALATEEHFRLFSRYMFARHADSSLGMPDRERFADFAEDNPTFARIIEYRDKRGKLLAASMSDLLPDGLSMVFSYFDPDEDRRSLGKFMILDHIDIARQGHGTYLYLGYWVPGCPKLKYKSTFDAAEVYRERHWSSLSDPDAYGPDSFPVLPRDGNVKGRTRTRSTGDN